MIEIWLFIKSKRLSFFDWSREFINLIRVLSFWRIIVKMLVLL